LYNHNSTRVDLRTLTTRELQVWWYLVRGYSNLSIAEVLVVDEKTIERHINAIYSKLRVSPVIENGQSFRTCLAWMAARDGALSTVNELGKITSSKNGSYSLDEVEQLIISLLKLGHSEKTISTITRISLNNVYWYIKLIAIKFGINVIPSEDFVKDKEILIKRLAVV